MNIKTIELKDYCEFKLNILESLLRDIDLSPEVKLRINTKIDILNHLINFNTYNNFSTKEEINRYIEDSTDIILGFYEH